MEILPIRRGKIVMERKERKNQAPSKQDSSSIKVFHMTPFLTSPVASCIKSIGALILLKEATFPLDGNSEQNFHFRAAIT